MATPKSRPVLGAALAALFCCPQLARAWSANGHKIIAQIAQDTLANDADGQKALAAIKQILGPAYGPNALASLSPCADQIKRYVDEFTGKPLPPGATVNCGGLTGIPIMPQSASWHFVDTPVGGSAADVAGSCKGGCVVDAIASQAAILSGQAQGNPQYALMFVVHLVGDAHQPLHCANGAVSDGPDHGFNCEQVSFAGARLALHSLWDHRISATDQPNWQSEAQRLETNLPTDGQAGDAGAIAAQAAAESFQDAQSIFNEFSSYPGFDQQNCANDKTNPPVTLPGNYQSEYAKVVDERLQMGGARLAAILKLALKNGLPTTTTPVSPDPNAPAAMPRSARVKLP